MSPLKLTLAAAAITLAVGGAAPSCDIASAPNVPGVTDNPNCDGEVSSEGGINGPTDPAYDGCCAGARLVKVEPDTPQTRAIAAQQCVGLQRDADILQSALNNGVPGEHP